TGQSIPSYANAMEFRADGTLFVGAQNSVYRVNPQTGAATFVLALPNHETSAGDLVFDSRGDLFVSTTDGSLVEAVPTLTSARLVGPAGALGVHDVNGLVYAGGTLYGFGDTEKAVYQINPSTGAATLLSSLNNLTNVLPAGVYGVATL